MLPLTRAEHQLRCQHSLPVCVVTCPTTEKSIFYDATAPAHGRKTPCPGFYTFKGQWRNQHGTHLLLLCRTRLCGCVNEEGVVRMRGLVGIPGQKQGSERASGQQVCTFRTDAQSNRGSLAFNKQQRQRLITMPSILIQRILVSWKRTTAEPRVWGWYRYRWGEKAGIGLRPDRNWDWARERGCEMQKLIQKWKT